MKKILQTITIGILILALATLTTACHSEKQEQRPLTVGMDAAYPPFGSQDMETKKYIGFDVDLIEAIAQEENLEITIRNVNFDGLIPALQTGDLDIVINDMTITEERKRNVDFSTPYYEAGLGIVVRKDNDTLHTEADLAGKTLGVTIGSTGEEAARKIKGAQIRVFSTLSDAFIDLKNGGVDGVVNDIPTNEYYVAKTGDNTVKTAPIRLTQENLGIAVKKGNTALLQKIETGLTKIKKNGKFTKIYQKWFKKEPPKTIVEGENP